MYVKLVIEPSDNKELQEKMRHVRNREEFWELTNEYGWDETVDVYAMLYPEFASRIEGILDGEFCAFLGEYHYSDNPDLDEDFDA